MCHRVIKGEIMASNAKQFFDKLQQESDPFGFLSDIPNRISTPDPFFEDEWIDFKGEPENEAKAKSIWSKALSGYANITDGLVVWGIDARKTPPKDIDAACGLRLISDPTLFESNLRKWHDNATNPPVTGVEYKSYIGKEGKGFVVCYVPQSRHKPHRAEHSEKQQYYYRAGDDFLPAGPSLLRVLFYPQNQPYLWPQLLLEWNVEPTVTTQLEQEGEQGLQGIVGKYSNFLLSLSLCNTGTASAKDIYLLVQSSPILNERGITEDWKPRFLSYKDNFVTLTATRSLHPSDALIVCSRLGWGSFKYGLATHNGKAMLVPEFDEFEINFYIYADNCEETKVSMRIKPDDFDPETRRSIKEAKPTV
jgi:hypothetical protein